MSCQYKHKSGAQKRKEKAERDKLAKNGQSAFDSVGFFQVKRNKTFPDNRDLDVGVVQEDSSLVCSTSSTVDTDQQDYLVKHSNFPATANIIASKFDQQEQNIKLEPSCSSSINEENKKYGREGSDPTLKYNFDIGMLEEVNPTIGQIEEAVRCGPSPHPKTFPNDDTGHAFPLSILEVKMKNGQSIPRDWLVWSNQKKTLFCFPCRLFCKLPVSHRSSLSNPTGYVIGRNWKKLYNRIPEHENSISHKNSYIEWRNIEKCLPDKSSVDLMLSKTLRSEVAKWRDILVRILDTILFLGERGLALHGESYLVGDPMNGNFLGILELISRYDPILREHLTKVELCQKDHRMQVHYLSPDSQNDFIQCCAEQVIQAILKEREEAKYFAIIVDATPDSAHTEQTVFVLHYLRLCTDCNHKPFYKIEERFLSFVDCNSKTGEAIAELIQRTLKKHSIPINDCRGQGYDNGANMKGQYKGAQNRLLKDNPLALFCPCAYQSLNLTASEAAECCPEAITFFGVLQKCYNIFSSSPQRWEILQSGIGCSLHKMSDTQWSARLEYVKPFAAHLLGIREAVEEVQALNLTAETRRDVIGIENYISSFECVLMSSIWYKVLREINNVSIRLQARESTIDVEISSISQLITNIKELRNSWEKILAEAKLLSENMNMEPCFPQKCQQQKLLTNKSIEIVDESPEEVFRCNVYCTLLDSVLHNLSVRYSALKDIDEKFNFLWKYSTMPKEEMSEKAKRLFRIYEDDISENIVEEMEHLRVIQAANFPPNLTPFELLNTLTQQKLGNVFPNLCIALRVFCTLPITVAEQERSFTLLARVKNFLRSTMKQDGLSYLGTLALESQLARQLDFQDIINSFAHKKAQKALLQ